MSCSASILCRSIAAWKGARLYTSLSVSKQPEAAVCLQEQQAEHDAAGHGEEADGDMFGQRQAANGGRHAELEHHVGKVGERDGGDGLVRCSVFPDGKGAGWKA